MIRHGSARLMMSPIHLITHSFMSGLISLLLPGLSLAHVLLSVVLGLVPKIWVIMFFILRGGFFFCQTVLRQKIEAVFFEWFMIAESFWKYLEHVISSRNYKQLILNAYCLLNLFFNYNNVFSCRTSWVSKLPELLCLAFLVDLMQVSPFIFFRSTGVQITLATVFIDTTVQSKRTIAGICCTYFLCELSKWRP